MSLDILSVRGQQSKRDEDAAAEIVERLFHCKYIETNKDSPAAVDAILIDSETQLIRAVIETKCRYGLTLEHFRYQFDSEWLVTWDKVKKGMELAKDLCTPFVGFLYLVDQKTLLVQQITDAKGMLIPEIKIRTSVTQATINGGSIARINAYIDMSKAKVYQ